MNKKILLLGVVLLLAGRVLAVESMIAINADRDETKYALSAVRKVVFDNNDEMNVNLENGFNVPGITCILFSIETVTKMLQAENSVWVFPNPVHTTLTVSGVDKDVKIKLFNLGGTLLKSIPAQENSTDIDVSSLAQGMYLLTFGEKTVKFTKQ